MMIGALLGVKDEVELIGRTIDHLRSIGVDRIVACDLQSTDGTFDVLLERQADDLTVVRLSDCELSPEAWVARERELMAGMHADWCIFLDADEFWLPSTGSLKTCVQQAADALSVARYNVPLGPLGPYCGDTLLPSAYHELFLFVQTIPQFQEYLNRHPEAAWSRGVPMRKVMARPSRIRGLTIGQHAALPNGDEPLTVVEPHDLLIAHLPFTTFARFERKVANIRRAIEAQPDFFTGQMAWHWKRWVRSYEAGELAEEFARQVLDDAAIDAFRRDGIVRSACEMLGGRQ
jgi:hypothetical protein